jgi:cell division protein FtsQ
MRQLNFDDRLLPEKTEGKRRRPTKRDARKPTGAKAPKPGLIGRALVLLKRPSRRTLLWGGGTLAAMAVCIALVAGSTGARLAGTIETGMVGFSSNAGFTVQNVYAEGRHMVPVQALLSALEVRRGEPIIAFDAAAARGRLEAIEWVQTATVERRLPDTIMVRLIERQPLAIWQSAGKLALIDRNGVVFGSADVARFAHLPLVVGEGAQKEAPQLFDALAAEPALFKRVVAAIWVGGRRWNIRFDSGLEVRLPEGAIDTAWARLNELVASRGLLERPVAAVDLRQSDRTVIRLRVEPSAPAPSDRGST